MGSRLSDAGTFSRFFSVSVVGMAVDVCMALLAKGFFGLPSIPASALGFLLGTVANYCGHSLFTYATPERRPITLLGYCKYMVAVSTSLVARLASVALLDFSTALPFWIVLLVSIALSFIVSYIISTIWVFNKNN
ncbi:MAG: GtrA family protein [Marinosulfonomonas sp.]